MSADAFHRPADAIADAFTIHKKRSEQANADAFDASDVILLDIALTARAHMSEDIPINTSDTSVTSESVSSRELRLPADPTDAKRKELT